MAVQLDLFADKKRKRPLPLARVTDKQTSHEAAEKMRPTLATKKGQCLDVIDGEMTAMEIATKANCIHNGGTETYRKRVHELVRDGELIECPARKCGVTGERATVYRIK